MKNGRKSTPCEELELFVDWLARYIEEIRNDEKR